MHDFYLLKKSSKIDLRNICVKNILLKKESLFYFSLFRLGTSSLTMEESLDQNSDFSDLVRR